MMQEVGVRKNSRGLGLLLGALGRVQEAEVGLDVSLNPFREGGAMSLKL